MLKKGKQHAEIFVFINVAVKPLTLHHFYYLTAASVLPKYQTAQIALLTLTNCLTRQPPCFACALQLQIFFLHCSLMHRQASRSQ